MNLATNIRAKVIYTLLSLSIFFTVVSAIITYYNTKEKRESMDLIIRRYKSIGSSEQLLSYVKDMETGQRGYVITGDSEFLQPYNQAKKIINNQKDTLRKVFAHDESQLELIEGKILKVADSKMREMENTVRIANRFGRDSAIHRINEKIGNEYMDTLRSLVGNLVQRERQLLSEQNARLEENTMAEDIIRFFAFVLVGSTSIAALIALIKRQQEVQSLLVSLETSNENLEMKVKDRTAELVKANLAKDHFLGIASHDLKVPLTGVLGLIRLMRDNNADRSKVDQEYLEYMEQACLGMQDLINNLLDINRIERGDTSIEKVVVNVDDLLNKLFIGFNPLAEKKLIKLVIPPCHLSLTTDPAALTRIMENLLSNAIKFSTAGKIVEVKVHQSKTNTTFEVLDQGIGIMRKEQPDLFKPFHRFSNKPTGGENSTGLGLAITKELTTLLGGQIHVTSLIGEGSQFVVILPNE